MSDWLSKTNPNVVIPIVAGALVFLYHQFVSPSTRAKVAQTTSDTIDTLLARVDQIMETLVLVAPKGTTKADLQAQLWATAKVQLTHIGINLDKIPEAYQHALETMIAGYLDDYERKHQATPPIALPSPTRPQEVPIPPPGSPPGAA